MDHMPELDTHLKTLRLPSVLRHYRQVADDARRHQRGYEQFLYELMDQEVTDRDLLRQRRLLRAARFPVIKALADFDFTQVRSLNPQVVTHLAEGHYLAQAESILCIGNPGVGKTHIATGLAVAACHQGHRVRFYTAASLVNELLEAHATRKLERVVSQALKARLLVIDELGFIPLTTEAAQLLFQFCSALHERVSLLVTTNLRFADWSHILGDERLTAALIDRLTHRGHILEFIGESYRFRQRLARHSSWEDGREAHRAS